MNNNWVPVCQLTDISPNTGVCAKVGTHQVAIFRHNKTEKLYALDNYDPFGNANVLSRGLLAEIGDKLTVASPLYKQHFDLSDGTCLEDQKVKVPVYAVRVNDTGNVEVCAG